MTTCGLTGSSGSFSITTLRGGGFSVLPGIVIILGGTTGGGGGGASRMINGSGVLAFLGFWRITIGGAGGGNLLALK